MAPTANWIAITWVVVMNGRWGVSPISAAAMVSSVPETLVVNGSQDLLTPPDHSEEIVKLVPGAEHVVINEAGHIIMLEHPEVVTGLLLSLIERGLRAAEDGIHVERKPRVRRTLTDVAKRRKVARARGRGRHEAS